MGSLGCVGARVGARGGGGCQGGLVGSLTHFFSRCLACIACQPLQTQPEPRKVKNAGKKMMCTLAHVCVYTQGTRR